MARPNYATVEIGERYDDRLRVEAYRRCQPGEDVRDVRRRLVERALAAVLGQLEAEDVYFRHSRTCRCPGCLLAEEMVAAACICDPTKGWRCAGHRRKGDVQLRDGVFVDPPPRAVGTAPGALPIAPPAFADGTAPGKSTVAAAAETCRGTDRSCYTHGRGTVHRGFGAVCPVTGLRPEPER